MDKINIMEWFRVKSPSFPTCKQRDLHLLNLSNLTWVDKWLSSWLTEQEVRGSIHGLATWISEIAYLLLPSRDMAEIQLNSHKSSIQPTNHLDKYATMTEDLRVSVQLLLHKLSYMVAVPLQGVERSLYGPIDGLLDVLAHLLYLVGTPTRLLVHTRNVNRGHVKPCSVQTWPLTQLLHYLHHYPL